MVGELPLKSTSHVDNARNLYHIWCLYRNTSQHILMGSIFVFSFPNLLLLRSLAQGKFNFEDATKGNSCTRLRQYHGIFTSSERGVNILQTDKTYACWIRWSRKNQVLLKSCNIVMLILIDDFVLLMGNLTTIPDKILCCVLVHRTVYLNWILRCILAQLSVIAVFSRCKPLDWFFFLVFFFEKMEPFIFLRPHEIFLSNLVIFKLLIWSNFTSHVI